MGKACSRDVQNLEEKRANETYESLEQDSAPLSSPQKGGCVGKLVGCCCCLLVVILVLQVAIGIYAGHQFVEKHLSFEPNVTMCSGNVACATDVGPPLTLAQLENGTNMWWPSCATDLLKNAMATFNAGAQSQIVKFKSRRGQSGQQDITIAAWWLPAADPLAPRIVVLHGNNVNFNSYTVQLAAYMLRSMGFACILPNLRDHGLSGNKEHATIGWGWDYHLDLLGAWDYAVNDPNGTLGGKVDKSRVGIMGFSMGGFVTSTAFGLEPDVPAAWVDSGVFEPKQVLEFALGHAVGVSLFGKLFGESAWFFAKQKAGIDDLVLRTPAKTLPAHANTTTRTKRSIAVTHGKLDTTVPPSQTDELVKLLAASPGLYDIKEQYYPESDCGDSTHCSMHVWKPDVYKQKLCFFWMGVFGLQNSTCNPTGTVLTARRVTGLTADQSTRSPLPLLAFAFALALSLAEGD